MSAIRMVGFVLLAGVAAVAAQVPLNQEPRHHATFENAQFRILNITVPPGETTLDHRHEFDLAAVSMATGAETRSQSNGQAWVSAGPSRPIGTASVTEYAGKPESHRLENVGKSAFQLFAVENLQTTGWSTAPPASGPGTTLATESRAFRIYDVRLGGSNSQTTHSHAVPTIVVLIDGKAMSDGPDTQAKANAPAAVGLRQLDQLGQWILVPRGDKHSVVRLGTSDARLVEIEVR